MKTAQQWQDELAGETSVQSIRAIQADALSQAISLMTVNADSPTRGFNAIWRLMLELVNSTKPEA